MTKKLKRRLRVIEQLRRQFPGKWTYEGWGRYGGPAFEVQAYSNLRNNYDGDDSTFTTYHRLDTGERLDGIFNSLRP